MNCASIRVAAALLILFVAFGCDNLGLAPPTQGSGPGILTGMVRFIGEMPAHVQYCYVVVAIDRPPNDTLDIRYLANYYDIPLPLPADTIRFRIEVGEGIYKWIFVAAIGNTDSISMNNVIGQYTMPGDTIRRSVTISSGQTIWLDTLVVDLRDIHIP